MKALQENWLTDGLIDFEYKKYLLLAYLQTVNEKFSDTKLYPYLADLIMHYQNILKFKKNKEMLYDQFPEKVSEANFQKLKLGYKKIIEDDDLLKEIESILNFSIPKIKEAIEGGKDLYEYVEQHIEFSPVGLSSLYQREGYMLIAPAHKKETKIYRYQLAIINQADETFHAVHVDYVESQIRNISNTFEKMKLSLTKKYGELPNPAAYALVPKIKIPFNNTLLPIAKRMLIRHISSTATK